MKSCWWKGAYTPGVDIGQQPDEVDAVDDNDALQSHGVDGLRRLRQVGWWFPWGGLTDLFPA